MFLKRRKNGISQILLVILLGSLFVFGYYYNDGRISLASLRRFNDPYCNVPIKIILGDIDPRFNLKNEVILKELKTASDAWEKDFERDLFIFDGKSKSEVIVNFIYDERQKETVESEKARSALASGWERYEDMINDRKLLANRYENLQDSYEASIENYNNRLDAYEQKVREWNRRQGTEAQYRALKAEETDIKQLFSNLERQRSTINSLAAEVNSSNSEIQSLYAELVEKTNEFNRFFSSDDPITVGEYDGTYYINIYQFTDLAQLRITLAHELGHALGMDHTENERSIMYPLQSKQSGDSLTLTQEDKAELLSVCTNDKR